MIMPHDDIAPCRHHADQSQGAADSISNRAFDALATLTRQAGFNRPVKSSVTLGSELIPVLDLGRHPGLAASVTDPDRRIVVVDMRGRITGMIIGVSLNTLAPCGLQTLPPEHLPENLAADDIVGAVRVGRRWLVGLADGSLGSGDPGGPGGAV